MDKSDSTYGHGPDFASHVGVVAQMIKELVVWTPRQLADRTLSVEEPGAGSCIGSSRVGPSRKAQLGAVGAREKSE